MSGVRRPGAGHPNDVSDRVARRAQANTLAIAQQEPSPLTVMLRIMRFNFALAQVEAAKGKAADQNIMRKILDSAHAAAKDCAPYVHRRLSPLHEGTTQWDLTKLSYDELEALERLLEKATSPPAMSSITGSTAH
jgi:hypothetical protein